MCYKCYRCYNDLGRGLRWLSPAVKRLFSFTNVFLYILTAKSIVSCKSHANISSVLRICSSVFVSENILPLKEVVLFWCSLFLNKFSLFREEFKFSASLYLSQNICTRKTWHCYNFWTFAMAFIIHCYICHNSKPKKIFKQFSQVTCITLKIFS